MNDFESKIERRLLKSDIVKALKSAIATGQWTEKLPSERYLTLTFRVSRGTLRQALFVLAEEGIIESVPKHGHFIRKIPKSKAAKPQKYKTIGLLIGDPDSPVPSRRINWLPELQSRLGRDGYNIHIHEAIPEIARMPEKAVGKLLQVSRHSCWLLVRCGRKTQHFFQSQNLPALICGSPFDGIDIPFIDIDYRAAAHHAAGLLSARGHSNIGFVSSSSSLAGDIASLEGFKSGIAESKRTIKLQIIQYRRPDYAFHSLLKGVAQKSNPITALFIDDPLQTINIATRALSLGINLSKDLYLVSRNFSVFLNYIHPTPGYYLHNPISMAHKIENRLRARLNGDPLKNKSTLLIPDFIG